MRIRIGKAARRTVLISALYSGTCDLCGRGPGQGCDPSVAAEMVRTDRRPGQLVIHSMRLEAVIASGAAPMALVLAQFSGPPPAMLTGAAPGPEYQEEAPQESAVWARTRPA